MKDIAALITNETYSHRGGGCEIELSALGYDEEYMSAYQNYLGGGMRGAVGNSCTIDNWQRDAKLVALAAELREYYLNTMQEHGLVDEYNEDASMRPLSYTGL